MDLQALADFSLVAMHGGVGRASRATGRPKATLSRRIMDLEESLGVRLIERGRRALRLTEEGMALHRRTEGLLAEIAEAARAVGAGMDRPRGRLRVSAPVLFSHVAMGRIAAGFLRSHPEVRLEVTAEDRHVGLVEDGYDVVIRVNPGPEDDLVGRCFLRDQLMIVAPPSVAFPWEGGGAAAELRLPAVVLATTPEDAVWRFDAGGRHYSILPEPVLRLSSLVMVHQAARAGAGIAMLSRAMIADDLAAARLACWGAVLDRQVELWALHGSRRLASRKVAAFIEHLCGAFPDGLLR